MIMDAACGDVGYEAVGWGGAPEVRLGGWARQAVLPQETAGGARWATRDQGVMFHCWQVLSSWAHWRTTVPFAVSQSRASRTMPLPTLLIV